MSVSSPEGVAKPNYADPSFLPPTRMERRLATKGCKPTYYQSSYYRFCNTHGPSFAWPCYVGMRALNEVNA